MSEFKEAICPCCQKKMNTVRVDVSNTTNHKTCPYCHVKLCVEVDQGKLAVRKE